MHVYFEFNEGKNLDALAVLNALQIGGPRVIASELNKAAMLWQREIKRHTPVDTGLLRNSWEVSLANADQGAALVAAVGTNVEYAPKLEFGDDRIAKGAVKAWQPGQAPIVDWPAKRMDATDQTVVKVEGDDLIGMNRQGKRVTGVPFRQSHGLDRTEFMPMMRASWPLVIDEIIQRLRNRLIRLLKDRR